MSVNVKLSEESWEAFEDEEHISYEWAIGSAGELYIVARDPRPREADSSRLVLFEGRYIEVVFSPLGWVKAEGTDCPSDVTRLRAAAL